MGERVYPLVDVALARRLERTEGHVNSRFVESRARLSPEVGATWMSAGGAYAMFDGIGSPLTQTFGLGLWEPVTSTLLDQIESFFFSRGADVFHEVSPLADPSALVQLTERGYRPCEFTSVTFQPLPDEQGEPEAASAAVAVRLAGSEDLDGWARTAESGWSEFAEVREFMARFAPMAAGADETYPFLAEIDGQPVGTGVLAMHEGVALLAGASTIPESRGLGAQRALLRARLRYAALAGCTVAMICASPGGGSQRNAERSGFRIAYTRIKWHKPRP